MHRLVTSSVVHADALHLVCNMLTLVPLATRLERHLGSVRLLYTVLLVIVSSSVIHVALAVLLALRVRHAQQLYASCTVGFSAALFAVLVVFVYKFHTSESIKLLGIRRLRVPSTLYPFVLLVVFQCLPRVSFLAHVSGLIVGFAYVHGFLDPIHPSAKRFAAVERHWFGAWLSARPGFVPKPGLGLALPAVELVDMAGIRLGASDARSDSAADV